MNQRTVKYLKILLQKWARATFFESTNAIPQLEGSTSAIPILQLFQEMLLGNHNSAIPQSQFFLKSATSSPQLESFTFAIFGIFLTLQWLEIEIIYIFNHLVFFASERF
jgi:hypothetical protein